jgi:hypothetical protein
LNFALHHGRQSRIAVPQIRLLFSQVCALLNMSLTNVRHSTDRASQRRAMADERGPFGKNTSRRGTSRSKGTPGGKKVEDKEVIESWKAIDDIFTKAKKRDQRNPAAEAANSGAPKTPAGVPTEVILYGYAEPYQWAAIEFYERVSQGVIYEDYEREPSNTKYDLSLARSTTTRSRIPSDALRKVSRYHGGEHWIKVTFNSAEAADRACYASPHKLNGHLVYAERYRGTGPAQDVAIPATEEALRSVTSSPLATTRTATAATAAASTPPANGSSATLSTSTLNNGRAAASAPSGASTATLDSAAVRGLRVRGAKRAVLLPADKALLPAASLWQRTFGSWPIVGFLFGGGASHEFIGSEVPRKDDGTFDWDTASMYWQFWATLDYYIFFANFLGLKGEE